MIPSQIILTALEAVGGVFGRKKPKTPADSRGSDRAEQNEFQPSLRDSFTSRG